jgi:hypothetical protein
VQFSPDLRPRVLAADREALRARVAHAGPVTDDTWVYRVAFHLSG